MPLWLFMWFKILQINGDIMATFDEQVLLLAEDLNSYLPLAVGDDRLITPEYVQWMSSLNDRHHNVVQRLRIAEGALPEIVEQTRARFVARGCHQATWEVGQHATPSDIENQLLKFGMVPDEPEPVAVGMVLAKPLVAPTASAVMVKPVETLDEYLACMEVAQVCFGTPHEENAQQQFELLRAEKQKSRWIAFLNGRAVAMADAIHLDCATVLSGGATLPDFRGQGVYRALLAARAAYAAKRGAPLLVTQAGSMSRPILRKLGFEEVSEIRIFVDTF